MTSFEENVGCDNAIANGLFNDLYALSLSFDTALCSPCYTEVISHCTSDLGNFSHRMSTFLILFFFETALPVKLNFMSSEAAIV